jgi:hypothetical protein
MELSRSTRSSKVYPNDGPLEMADATADFKKSIIGAFYLLQAMTGEGRPGGDRSLGPVTCVQPPLPRR